MSFSILLFCDNVTMEFSGQVISQEQEMGEGAGAGAGAGEGFFFTFQDGREFKGSKQGRLYLTTHRMIFNNKKTEVGGCCKTLKGGRERGERL